MNTVLARYENLILRDLDIAAMKSELDRKTRDAITERNCNLASINDPLNSAKGLARHNYQISMN